MLCRKYFCPSGPRMTSIHWAVMRFSLSRWAAKPRHSVHHVRYAYRYSWRSGNPGPCLTTAKWRCRKNCSQWERSFLWKLRCHWLEFLRQCQIAVVRQSPGHARRLTDLWIKANPLTDLAKGVDKHCYCQWKIPHKNGAKGQNNYYFQYMIFTF